MTILLSGALLSTLFLGAPLFTTSQHAAHGFQTAGQFASIVMGEPNFVSATEAATRNHFFHPFRVAFDSSGDLWVADENNHRVLEFKPPLTDGESASLVLGQSGFTTRISATAQNRFFGPVSLAFDPLGDLWVADLGNSRVLEFMPPFSNGMNASVEIGQLAGAREFTSNLHSAGPNGLNAPVDIKFDRSGSLWVTDRLNNRVLEFKPPFSNGMNASLVVGQSDLNSTSPLISPSETSLDGPNGISFDSSGNLWVADENFNRVLEFGAASLVANSPAAILEIGQHPGADEFASAAAALNTSGLNAPFSVAFDPTGNLWVSDRANNRVLEFAPPFTDGMNASAVIGQPAGPNRFTSNATGLTQTSLWNPLGLAFDSWGDLWVADQLNNRVLEFSNSAVSTTGFSVNVPAVTDETRMNVSSSNACYLMAEQAVCHLNVNQTSATGVQTEMIGVASASTVNVYSSYLGSQEPAYSKPQGPQAGRGVAPATAFYGLAISGIGNGTATVCVDQKEQQQTGQVIATGAMTYFSNGGWSSPTSVSRSGPSKVCGTIPLSALSSAAETTVIAIGRSSGGGGGGASPSPLAATPWLYALILVVALVVSAYYLLRRRSRNRGEEDEQGDAEYEDQEEESYW